MSLATSEPQELKFLAPIRARLGIAAGGIQVRQGLGWSCLAAALGLAALAVADYRLELPCRRGPAGPGRRGGS